MDQHKEYRIRIEQDDPIESPRDWDNLGTMVCWHRRYNLGDIQPAEPPDQYFAKIRSDIISLPLFLYDHSGITMNTTGFSCPWDSGQVGWIYITKEKARAEYGWKRITAEREQQIIDALKAEVAVYAQYLEGDVHGFILESRPAQAFDADGNPLDVEIEWEEEDSCWGFYGSDPFENGMADYIDEKHHELLKEAA